MKELDRFEPVNKRVITITKEQKTFLTEAKKKGLCFIEIANLWNRVKDWKKLDRRTLNDYWLKIERGEL
jgi:hypothetical protein